MLTGHFSNSGVQNHSCGDLFPVRTVLVGDNCLVATAFGVELHSYSRHQHNKDLFRLKTAEKITDRIVDAYYNGGTGCTVRTNLSDTPLKGYVVGIHGHESIFPCPDIRYNPIFADVVVKLGNSRFLHDVCIGSWIDDYKLYVDISVNVRVEHIARQIGWNERQLAIWDVDNNREIRLKRNPSR